MTTQEPREVREKIAQHIRSALADAWNDICADTGCHPLDITREGRKLYFTPNHWADQASNWAADSILSLFPASPPVEGGSFAGGIDRPATDLCQPEGRHEPADAASRGFEVGKPAPYYCKACQAVPQAGYCKLAGCPTAPASACADPSGLTANSVSPVEGGSLFAKYGTERVLRIAAERRAATFEDCLRTVCHHLELPQSDSGPCDDSSRYDRALEALLADNAVTEAERKAATDRMYRAEAALQPFADAAKGLSDFWADQRRAASIAWDGLKVEHFRRAAQVLAVTQSRSTEAPTPSDGAETTQEAGHE